MLTVPDMGLAACSRGALLLVALMLGVVPAASAASYHLTTDATCIDTTELVRRVTVRTLPDVPTPQSTPWRYQVSVHEASVGAQGEVRGWYEGDFVLYRTIEGEDCSAVADALAIVVGLHWTEARRVLAQREAAQRQVAVSGAPADEPAGARPMATAAPRPTRDLPLGADSGTRDQSKGETFALGAATGLSSQLGVGFGPTLSALAEAGWSRRLLLQLGLDYLPSRTHAAREGSVRLWLTSARAGIKWRAWRFGATSLAPVVLYQGGLITARGVAIADRQTTRDDFHAFGAKLALDVALDSWELGLSAGGSVLAKMHSFSAEYGKSRLELHELPRWSGSVEASGKFWLF